MSREKFLPDDPREFAKFFRERAEGHAPGYDLAVYGRPHQLMAIAKTLEDASVAATVGWQPITTAPKDGREVLLKVAYRAGIPGKCLVGHYMPGGHCISDHPPIDEGWYFWNGCYFDNSAKPLEWMALPADTPVPRPLRGAE